MKSRAVATISLIVTFVAIGYAVWVNAQVENTSALFGMIAVILGGYLIGAAGCDWDWFMESRAPSIVVSLCSRPGARIVYAFVGLAFVLFGLWFQSAP